MNKNTQIWAILPCDDQNNNQGFNQQNQGNNQGFNQQNNNQGFNQQNQASNNSKEVP